MSSPPHPDLLRTTQFAFVDAHGRKIHLRGVNLSGSSKTPINRPSHLLEDFWETAEAGGESFIGQPLNLEDGSGDEHLARLRGWGFNLLRFPVTWEALEHAGPKKYDYEFMDYIVRVLLKCKQYGFRVYVDPHQDTWSRFSGGSGAPFWTLPACGINPYHISATQAALIHSEWPLPHSSDPSTFPAMIWGTNYGRLFSLTLFTLFFAGRAFAPNCIIDSMNIQDYLQSHYISAFGKLGDRIRRADEEEGAGLRDACIIGWDSLNEPAEGLVSWDDLNKNPTQQGTTLKKGTTPTPAQSLRLGMGKSQTVDCWDFGTFGPKRTGTVTIDPKGRKVWAEPDLTGTEGGELPDGTHPRWGWKRDVTKWPLGTCIWALHGVWDVESGYVLRPDYFKYHPATGIEVEFLPDFWLPHFRAYGERVRSSHPDAILFIQPPVFAMPPSVDEETLKGRCAYTGHYYDGLTLITKHWNWFNADSLGVLRGKYRSPLQAVKIGERAIRNSIMEQIGVLKSDAKLITAPPPSQSRSGSAPSTRPSSPPLPPSLPAKPNEYPTVIGEIGTPFDMDKKYSYYTSKGDYANQQKALDASLNACDGYNNVSYTVWTYLARGHTHQWGDGWNGEDLSLWSPDDLRSTYTDATESEGECCSVGGLTKRRRGSSNEPAPLKSESQARLLGGGGRSTGVLGSKNVSTLSLNTISTRANPPVGGEGGGESPVLLTPSASTPTLALLSKKPSVTFSSKTIVDDIQTVPSLPLALENPGTVVGPPKMQKTSSSSSTLTSGRDVDPDADPYDFLTDGARAVRAFCRPRPVKVLGKILDTKFEISKAEFKCVIQAPAPVAPVGGEGEGEEVATEIYLPLVHFASRDLLESSKARWDPEGKRSERMEMESPKGYGWKNHLVMSDRQEDERRVLEGLEGREDLLDVEVKASCGRWRIKGQTLFWWYNTTTTEGTQCVIEVKRRGGAIKLRKGGWVEVKSWQGPQSLRKGDGSRTAEEKSWCERLCDCEGCIIM